MYQVFFYIANTNTVEHYDVYLLKKFSYLLKNHQTTLLAPIHGENVCIQTKYNYCGRQKWYTLNMRLFVER